jgi:Ca2+-binding EF-hand superfamily protein
MDAARSTLVAAKNTPNEPPDDLAFEGTSTWFAHKSKAKEVTLTKKEFRSMYKRSTGREVSDEEIDLLFDLLDANGDGQLQLHEVVSMLEKRDVHTV